MRIQPLYNLYGNPDYRPGSLVSTEGLYFTATNTAGVRLAPITVSTTGITYLPNAKLNIRFTDSLGFPTSFDYTVPASGYNAAALGELASFQFAGVLDFYSPASSFGVGNILVMPHHLGNSLGYSTPFLTLTNYTTNVSVNLPLSTVVEKRIAPGRIVVRDYVSDDDDIVGFPSTSSSYLQRQFFHTVRPHDTIAVADAQLAFAGVSGTANFNQLNNRNDVRSTGQGDTVRVYHRALLLVEKVPGSFSTTGTNNNGLFAETLPGQEGMVTDVASATTNPLPVSNFQLVGKRTYPDSVLINVNTY